MVVIENYNVGLYSGFTIFSLQENEANPFRVSKSPQASFKPKSSGPDVSRSGGYRTPRVSILIYTVH